jgi:hypothetical protein
MSERDICERLDEKSREPTETVMRQWDQIRHQVETLPGASMPRDNFEGLVDWLVGDCAEAAATIRALRTLLRRADTLLAEFPSDASYGSSEEWRDRVRMFLEERS